MLGSTINMINTNTKSGYGSDHPEIAVYAFPTELKNLFVAKHMFNHESPFVFETGSYAELMLQLISTFPKLNNLQIN